MENETWLGQIRHGSAWLDYARGTEAQSRLWQQADPTNRQVVDWIDKGKVLVPAQEAK